MDILKILLNAPQQVKEFALAMRVPNAKKCSLCGESLGKGHWHGNSIYECCGICTKCAFSIHWIYDFHSSGGVNAAPKKDIFRRPISPSKVLSIFARDNYRCKKCATMECLTVDHIKPIKHGGTNDLNNLQTLCRSCNAKKGAKNAT